jgi:hypothetical protein
MGRLGHRWNGEEHGERAGGGPPCIGPTPLCLDVAKSDPEFATKIIELKKASSYSRSDFVVAAGWGTKLATDDINRSVARTCADTLLL